jgi:predicted RNase H-like HicB family nuclease
LLQDAKEAFDVVLDGLHEESNMAPLRNTCVDEVLCMHFI